MLVLLQREGGAGGVDLRLRKDAGGGEGEFLVGDAFDLITVDHSQGLDF